MGDEKSNLLFDPYVEKVHQKMLVRDVIFSDDIDARRAQLSRETNPYKRREIEGIIKQLSCDREDMFSRFYAAAEVGEMSVILEIDRVFLPGVQLP